MTETYLKRLTNPVIFASLFLVQSCSVDVGGNEDGIAPSLVIDAVSDGNDSDGELIGDVTVQWTTTDPNPSTVDIYLSADGGATFPTVLAINEADDGEFSFDSNSVNDCLSCRVRIIPTDVVGNVGAAIDSTIDLVINNVPQLNNEAYFIKKRIATFGPAGAYGCDDEIVLSFDKDIDIRLVIPRDLRLPVAGDDIQISSVVEVGDKLNEIKVVLNDGDCTSYPGDFRFKLAGVFDQNTVGIGSATGIDIVDGLLPGTIKAVDTGRDAQPSFDGGVDILPTYAGSPLSVVATTTVAVAAAYLDGDGFVDIISINTDNLGLQALYRITDSSYESFSGGLQALDSPTNTSVTTGDINDDGDIDIIVGDSTGSRVYSNDGDGNFMLSATLTDSNTQAVALVNVDGDADLDLVTASGGANEIWLNNGVHTGTFSSSGQTLGAADSRGLAVGDIDGDDDIDILTANADGTNRVWRNNGSGIFAEDATVQTLDSNDSRAVVLADFDADGDLDAAFGNSDADNSMWLNDGSGVFSDSGQAFDDEDTRAIVAADYDIDGDIDIITGNIDDDNGVWLNDGSGVFSEMPYSMDGAAITVISSVQTTSLAVIDLHEDGDPDLIDGISNTVSDAQWINPAHLPWFSFRDSEQSMGDGDSEGVALADLDGDGDLDMVVANEDEANTIFFNDGDGVFADSGQELGVATSSSVAVADVDGDGDIDVAFGNRFQANTVWLNDGAGVFTPSANTLGNSDTQSVVFADIDGINGPDIISGNLLQPNRVWRNDGNGMFSEDSPTPQTLGSGPTTSIAMADIDDDGDLDMVSGNTVTSSNRVWRNTGINSGVFTEVAALLSSSTVAVAFADVDQDGDNDIVEANTSNQDSRVWLNDGSGNFSDSGQQIYFGFGIDVTDVDVIDYDNDSYPDLVFSIARNAIGQLVVNRNRGRFSAVRNVAQVPSTAPIMILNVSAVESGDIDGDGDQDLVFAFDGGDGNQVHMGNR